MLSAPGRPAIVGLEFADPPNEHRYELRADGVVLGFAAYRLRPGLIALTHTQIDPRLAVSLVSRVADVGRIGENRHGGPYDAATPARELDATRALAGAEA